MKKAIYSIAALSALLLLTGAGCGAPATNQADTNTAPAVTNTIPTPEPVVTNTAPTPAQPSQPAVPEKPVTAPVKVTKTINIQNFAFNPTSLTVKKGTTVVWTNDDQVPHQIKSATFNSSTLSNSQTFSFTFDTVGAFPYSCAIHPSMQGTIIVE
ncbi:MAG: cupredoxin domain-containing protein [Patescibacteria group bacterium]